MWTRNANASTMILLALLVVVLPQVLGDELVKEGNCNGTPTDPGKTVENCNYYCRQGNEWVNTYFPVGTKCQYEPGRMGTCLKYEGSSTACSLDEDASTGTWGHGTTVFTNEGEETTTPSKRKKKKQKKQKTNKPKRPTNGTTKSKDKKKKKKKRQTQVVEW
ncbi:uncharacterized protein LOC142572962 [Dermacentor variabilis]|uniref:uncharacterized protein LOC142572962 n=1 Tax=Dermacentor variabilis TaxID=34621 RepID=UPI003F5C0EC6